MIYNEIHCLVDQVCNGDDDMGWENIYLHFSSLNTLLVVILLMIMMQAGLHNLCHPTIRDGSTWSKFGARGEHGDVFLFSNLGAL